jgi:type VI secretion system protein ImpK
MNNPLEQENKTVFAPTLPPGSAGSPAGGGAVRNVSPSGPALQIEYRSGLNPLMEDATEIFMLHYRVLKGHFREVESLRAMIQDGLLKFELRAQQRGSPKAVIKSAKYVLCTFIDEVVMQQFGHESSWGQRTLLAQFFNETWGGATLFKIRQFCLENIHDYADLLEMIYVCLCLGFKGQYGTLAQGEVQLERLKRETYQAIVSLRGDHFNEPLSPHGKSNYEGRITLKRNSAWRLLLGVSLGFLVVAYLSLTVFINIQSAPVYAKVMAALT